MPKNLLRHWFYVFCDKGSTTVFVEEDNAELRPKANDPDLIREGKKKMGFVFVWFDQPPNSPNLNVLHLGFFRAIQSLQLTDR